MSLIPTCMTSLTAAMCFTMCLMAFSQTRAADKEKIVPVELSEGHEIGKNDYGRPVVLIAAALEVKPEVFREAFSGVTPARGRGPTGDEARKNKAALMRVLAPHGVTNDRLDQVSDYYRFQPQSGRIWTHKPAKAHAVIVDGQIDRIVITEPGSGYSSLPQVTVPGFEKQRFEVSLSFSKELKKNGAIAEIKLANVKPVRTTKS